MARPFALHNENGGSNRNRITPLDFPAFSISTSLQQPLRTDWTEAKPAATRAGSTTAAARMRKGARLAGGGAPAPRASIAMSKNRGSVAVQGRRLNRLFRAKQSIDMFDSYLARV
jgi:hypothetical protein